MDPMPARYAIRIHGHLGATVLSVFPALVSEQPSAVNDTCQLTSGN